ncbi:hypothetical protein TNCV_1647291 [Trichonephila clavipes]|nr:hypothetical protein TNCV_1647291 [Trichonephila clavipes]
MTGVLLAPCHDEFRGPRSDNVRQVALALPRHTESGASFPSSYVKKTQEDIVANEYFCAVVNVGSRTSLHVFDAGIINSQCYRNEVLETYMRLLVLPSAMSIDYNFMVDNADLHRAHIIDKFNEEA